MDNTTTQNLNFTKQIAIGSFCIGTLLFILYWVFKYFNLTAMNDNLIMIGLWFSIIAFIINLFVLIYVLSNLFRYPDEYTKIFKYAGILVSNLPIAIGYLYIILNVTFPLRG